MRRKKEFKKENKEVFFYLPFGEMHCSDMNKEKKVHLVCWIMCKLVITQSEYLYNCLYFFIMILERNVFIFLTSVPDVSSVGLTLWLVWWDSYLCIEPLLWWILCMQCLGNTVGNMGEELILGAFDQFVFIYFIILLINCEKQHACACAVYFVQLLLLWSSVAKPVASSQPGHRRSVVVAITTTTTTKNSYICTFICTLF